MLAERQTACVLRNRIAMNLHYAPHILMVDTPAPSGHLPLRNMVALLASSSQAPYHSRPRFKICLHGLSFTPLLLLSPKSLLDFFGVRVSCGHLCLKQKHRPSRQARPSVLRFKRCAVGKVFCKGKRLCNSNCCLTDPSAGSFRAVRPGTT